MKFKLSFTFILLASLLTVPLGLLVPAEVAHESLVSWSLTGSTNVVRAGNTATLLPNGKVLVAGGFGSSDFPTASAELYSLPSMLNEELGRELLPGS